MPPHADLAATETITQRSSVSTTPSVIKAVAKPPKPTGFAAIKPYISLLRFSYHQNFLVVIIGAILFPLPPTAPSGAAIALDILKLYFSFNICFYGALYSINAVTDAEEDARHPEKRNRPVASGVVSKKQAVVYIAGLLGTGFSTAYLFFGLPICGMFLLFLVLNLGYSFGMRNAKFMRFWTAGLTSPCRVHLGAMVTGAQLHFSVYFLAYFFMTALQSSKIRIENRKLKATVNGFQPGTVEAISFTGTAIALYYFYYSPQFSPIVAFIVVFQNFLYNVMPNLSGAFERGFRRIYTADC